jgi:hypothetical protein
LRQLADIRVGDAVFTGTVFATKDPADCSFAVVDEQMRPVSGVARPSPPREAVDHYLARIKASIANSEGIIPGQVAYIPSHYVQPQLCLWHNPSSEVSIHDLPDTKRLLIVGEPGAGKTSLLRHLALAMIADEEDSSSEESALDRLPVYISLRQWTSPRDIYSALQNTIAAAGGEWVASNLRELAKQGTLVLLLDGLDEVDESSRQKVVQWLVQFGRSYPRTQIIVTTRPHAEGALIRDFTPVTIKPFDSARVRDFAYRRLYRGKSWRQFVSCYRECHDMQHVLGNPLLLSIATYLYRRSDLVPQNSAQLIKDFVTALTDTWDSSRGVKRHYDRELTPERVRNALGRLAFQCLVQGRNAFTTGDATSWLDSRAGDAASRAYLERLREITGLLCMTQADTWTFSHRVFMDYFAANYAVDRAEGVYDLFSKHAEDMTWARTWSHAAGLTSDPDYLCQLYTDRSTSDAAAVAGRAAAVILQSVVMGARTLSHGTSALVSALETCIEEFDARVNVTIDRDREGRETGTGEALLTFAGKVPPADDMNKLGGLIRDLKMTRWTTYGEDVQRRIQQSSNDTVAALALLFEVKGTMIVRTDESSVRIAWEPESPEMPFE